MLAKIFSAGLSGIDGYAVTIEADGSGGLPRSVIVGNVSPSVREAMERCQVGLKNSGICLPPRRLTINIAPADRRKDGTCFDLAITVGLLKAVFPEYTADISGYGFLGEVGLDGSIHPVKGMLSMAAALKEAGVKGVVVPEANAAEAKVIEELDVIGINDLKTLCVLLEHQDKFESYPRAEISEAAKTECSEVDFSEVRGQAVCVRAALIAAAGNHNLMLSGIAGTGKSMIARRIPTIMPPLTREEDISITRIYSASGLLPAGRGLLGTRPFRSPHHSITVPALIGGQRDGMTAGEISLASKGVLFMDELPLFSRMAIEALREPLEEKTITINRLGISCTYPADGLLVAALNPCPCGYYPDRTKCRCTPAQIRAYQRGISRPILERIDLLAEAVPVDFSLLQEQNEKPQSAADGRILSSQELREQVIRARAIQRDRFRGQKIRYNSEIGAKEIPVYCRLGKTEAEFMEKVYRLKNMSIRTYHKALKVARTIADLEGEKEIAVRHLSEAVSFRGLEGEMFGG